MESDTVKCPECKKEAKLISYGGGYVAECCGKLIYNSKKKPRVKCGEENCGGDINDKFAINTAIGGCCTPQSPLYPCNKCGRLHEENGSPFVTKEDLKVFF